MDINDVSLINELGKRLQYVKARIADAERRYHRKPGSVSLLAVSKQQPFEKIITLNQLGQHCFGENYLQEAVKKIVNLHISSIEWHFIGHIQSNKTLSIAHHFCWVHSVSTHKIAQRLNDQRPENLPPLSVCIQVNISQEATKAGLYSHELMHLVEFISSLPRLKLRGLMTLPQLATGLDEQRKSFNALAILFQRIQNEGIQLDTLSMGTSADLEAAIAEGATMVRIGTDIFGKRESK